MNEIKITYRQLEEAGRKVDPDMFEEDGVDYIIAEAQTALQAIGFQVTEKPSIYLDIQEPHITFRDPSELGYTPIEWIQRLARIVNIAANILEPADQDEGWLDRIRAEYDPEEFGAGLLYYQSMLSGLWGADDTCYDYHNSFVSMILDYVAEIVS